MSDNFFDRIEQEILFLQQRKAALKAENEDLHRQLTSLRNGQNIQIDILGQRFSFSYSTNAPVSTPLALTEQATTPAGTPNSAQMTPPPRPMETPLPTYNPTLAVKITPAYNATPEIKATPTYTSTSLVETHPDYQATPSIESLSTYGATPSIKAAKDALESEEDEPEVEEGQKSEQTHNTPLPQSQPTFLEEIMLDEFAAAATSPMAVWTGPIQKHKPINEEQKEALRRELMGSFLLE